MSRPQRPATPMIFSPRNSNGVMRPYHDRLASQQGQALTEFLVIALALIPLFLLIPLIGKYQDISHAVQMASRYVAFNATLRNDSSGGGFEPEGQLSGEVRSRFFSNPNAPIRTNAKISNSSEDQNQFWRDPTNQPLIHKLSDVVLSFGDKYAPTQQEGFSGLDDTQPYLISNLMGLNSRGMFRANVTVPLIKLPAEIASYEPFDKINITITRHTSLILDPWAASSPGQAESRVKKAAVLPDILSDSQIEMVVDYGISFAELFQVKGPQFNKLEQWRDVIPSDRLQQEKGQ